MAAVVLGLAPIFLLIVLGYGLRATRFVSDAFWPAAERLTYFILFPALLVSSTAKAELHGLDLAGMGAALAVAVLAIAGATLALRRVVAPDGPGFTSVFQGAIRPNTYVGLAAAASLFGPEGTTLAAIGVVAVVPLVNMLSVAVMQRHATNAGGGLKATALGIARNPLIGAVAVGAVLNAAGVHRLPVVTPLLDILGAASLPIGLLAVGAGLDIPAARASSRSVMWASGFKLAALPMLTLALAAPLGVTGTALAVAVLYNGLPCSASSYVLARQMGGDHRLMAGIITVQTLAAVLTLPALLLFLAA